LGDSNWYHQTTALVIGCTRADYGLDHVETLLAGTQFHCVAGS
jgi:hypothetical protein